MKRILVDMDNILVDILPTWLKRYNWLADDRLTIDQITGWKIDQFIKPGCSDQLYSALDEPDFFRFLPPFDGAIEAMKNLEAAGLCPVVCTAMTSAPHAIMNKAQWVKRHLPSFDLDKQFIVCGPKHTLLCDGIIDDKPSTLVNFMTTQPKVVRATIAWPWSEAAKPYAHIYAEDWKSPAKAWQTIVDELIAYNHKYWERGV